MDPEYEADLRARVAALVSITQSVYPESIRRRLPGTTSDDDHQEFWLKGVDCDEVYKLETASILIGNT